MNRQDFINLLFNNNHGLTLRQIRYIEDALPDTVPEGMVKDLIDNNGYTEEDAHGIALMMARKNFINGLHDCIDLLEIDDFMIENYRISLTDEQIYALYYLK